MFIEALLAVIISSGLSLVCAAFLSYGLLAGVIARMVPFSAGMLLAASWLHLIPEAFESEIGAAEASSVVLVTLIAFFLLERFSILRHDHHHEADGHQHPHGFDSRTAGSGVPILVGDSVHNFTDGLMIAAAFQVDATVGWLTAVAIFAHEIPQELGDFIVLSNAGFSRRKALIYNLISGAFSVLGVVLGWVALDRLAGGLPYALALSAASFLYIALSDLVPQMHSDRTAKWGVQFAMIVSGVLCVFLLSQFTHAH